MVSIIIPTYNRGQMIGDAIKSALQQTYPNKQVIVVDDDSTDNTRSVVESFPGVMYVHQPHARQAAARNNGWRHSSGKYIANLDSDDRWEPEFLETCIGFLEEENLDFVFANWHQQRIEGDTYDFLSHDPYLKPYLKKIRKDSWVTLEPHDLRELYIKGCPSPSSSLVIRASSLVGWNEKMNIGDDWCMLLDMIMPGNCRAAFTLRKLWWKRINCNNVYDGRYHIEVNRLLYVEDTRMLMERFANVWTEKEYKYVEKKYLKQLVRSAKHSLVIYSNPVESIRLLKRALSTNPVYAFRVFTRLFIDAGKRQLIKLPPNVGEV
jgi:glycosyltransferase involved in cell wall biosynthesis